MELKLLKDILAVKVLETKLSDTIIIDAEMSIEKGEVMHVGEKCTEVKKGDIVYFSHRVGQGFKYGDEDLLVMHEAELMGVEEKE